MLLAVMACSPFCLSWCGGVARSFVVVVYARVAAPRRTVSVKLVPYALGPSSPCRRAGGCVWFPSTMAKMVYISYPSWWLSSCAYSMLVFMMWAVWFPRL